MYKIAVHSRSFEPEKLIYFERFFAEITKHQVAILLSKDLAEHLEHHSFPLPKYTIFRSKQQLSSADVMFSLGGDGTLLETATYTRGTNVPVMGINTGRLGFLANTPATEITEGVAAVFNGYYEIDERTMIQLESDKDIFGDMNFGLNEFAITKRDTSSMIIVHTYIDGEYLNSYWADGFDRLYAHRIYWLLPECWWPRGRS